MEVQAPYGYVLDSEPVYFDVVQENSEEESGITVIEVVRSNLAQKGTITVEKSGEIFSSVSENNGMYQPNFAVGNLEGAVYEITAAEDIVTLEGTVRAKKGEVVDTLTTGADGTAKSKKLYLGKYEVKEVTAPNGMVLNDEIHSVELVYTESYAVYVDNESIALTTREFDILKILLENQGRVFSRDNLLNSIWGYDYFGDEKIVNTHIKNIRRKMGMDYMETIRGVGYKIEKEN